MIAQFSRAGKKMEAKESKCIISLHDRKSREGKEGGERGGKRGRNDRKASFT